MAAGATSGAIGGICLAFADSPVAALLGSMLVAMGFGALAERDEARQRRDDASPASSGPRAPAPRRRVWRPQARAYPARERTTPPLI